MFGAALTEVWANMPPIEEVYRVLDEWGIGDRGLGDDAARRRYARFEGVDFGVAPREAWPKLRQDLLEFEEHLAAEQHDVGLVEEFPFAIELKKNVRIHQKPTPLPPEQREWVNREFAAMEAQGVVRRVPDAQFTSKVVLVAEGQQGQDFRLCVNFVDLNQMTKDMEYSMKDAW
jgi:hypothetical protein